jgi:cyclopropane fatty-acyl-phospholipid synthase-like methyltransferase
MPYAAKDRKEFIERSNLTPDSRILDLGGMLIEELTSAVYGITSKRSLSNAVLIRPLLLPFKNSVFRSIISYHYFDLVSSDKLGFAFEEASRVLDKDGSFSFMILQWTANNEAQKSNLLFNEVLKSIGALYQHDLEEISKNLNKSGFTEITVESIKREIPIPQEFINEHLLMLGNLVKIEKTKDRTVIKAFAKQYFHHTKEHGEALLPAIHFIARK